MPPTPRLGREPEARASLRAPWFVSLSRPLHEAVDDLLLAGLLEGDGELVALDAGHLAVAELDVEHPFAALVDAGPRLVDCHQPALAVDHLAATVALDRPRPGGHAGARLRPLPPRRRVAGAAEAGLAFP